MQENNMRIFKKLMRKSLEQAGDFCRHCHTGVFAYTMQIAVKLGIPLVIWGEASSEYRVFHSRAEIEYWMKKFEEVVDLGNNADKMYELIEGAISKRDLMPFEFPSKEEMERPEAKPTYLGNYVPWHTNHPVETIKRELDGKNKR